MEFTQTVSAPQSDVVAPPIAVKEPVTSAVAPVIDSGVGEYKSHIGRFPANLVLDEEVNDY